MQPCDLSRLHLPFTDKEEAELRTLLAERCTEDNLPDGVLNLIKEHIRRKLRGRVALYPAGWLSLQVLDAFADNPECALLGLFDARHADLGSVQGLPVLPLEQARAWDFDQVLVVHGSREDEFCRNLARAGIPGNKIVRLFSASIFGELWDDAAGRPRSNLRNVIIRTDFKQILGDLALASVLPPEQTFILRPGAKHSDDGDTFPVFATVESWPLVRRLLLQLQPATVYLQVNSIHFFLYEWVRESLPGCTIVMEMWDMWAISMDHFPGRHIPGVSAAHARLNQLAEAHALRTADLVISKRAGAIWREALERLGTRYRLYHSGLDCPQPDRDSHTASAAAPLRIVYASGMNPPAVIESLPEIAKGRNPLPLLRVFRAAGFAVEVFNADHFVLDQDAYFAGTMEECAASGIAYHRRSPLRELFGRLGEFDFGLVSAGLQTYTPDHRVVVSATATTFAAAGIPLIVFEDLAAIAELVREFGAGIVASDESPEELARIIRSSDPGRLRQGARALADHLRAGNRRTLEALGRLLRESGGSRSAGTAPTF